MLILCILFNGLVVAQKESTFIFSHDMLKFDEKNCRQLGKDSFYRYRRLLISTKYKLVDSIGVGKTSRTKILVLSPLNQEEFGYTVPCYLLIRRILMVYDDSAGDDPVSYITDKVILNRYDWQSDPYLYGQSIKRTDSGFSLAFSAGSKIKCDLEMFFVVRANRIYLDRNTTFYYSNAGPRTKSRAIRLGIKPGTELSDIETMKLFDFPDW
jgi:hypothetical protein